MKRLKSFADTKLFTFMNISASVLLNPLPRSRTLRLTPLEPNFIGTK
jgi:hypothetical protein